MRLPVPGPISRTVWLWEVVSHKTETNAVGSVLDATETYVALLEVGFLDDCLRYTRVLQDVLAEVCVHLEYIVSSSCRLRTIRRIAAWSATLFLCLWHCGKCLGTV